MTRLTALTEPQHAEFPGFEAHRLDDQHVVFRGQLPDHLIPDQSQFDKLWNLHPAEYPEILMHGKLLKTPRRQQSYGHDYRYPGQSNAALPIPDLPIPHKVIAHRDHLTRPSTGVLATARG